MGIVGRKRGFLALLLPICFAILLGRFPMVLGLNYREYRQVSSLRLERIKTHLDQINKPAVMTIEVCVSFLCNSTDTSCVFDKDVQNLDSFSLLNFFFLFLSYILIRFHDGFL